MAYLLIVIHVLICLFLITVILLQSGSAGDIASAFGGLGSQTAFGPRGAQTAMGKATIVCAALFMVISLALAIISANSSPAAAHSILGAGTSSSAPKTPAKTPAPPHR